MPNETIKHISYENLTTFSTEMKKKYARKGDIPTAVSALTNDAKYQTEEQVAAAINAKVASTYRAGGSAAFADLPALEEANRGLVVNVTDKFTTTESFVEGAGKKHPAGTNVAVVQVGDAYQYDVLAGFVDLSGYAEAAQVATDIGTAKAEAIQAAADSADEKLADYVKAADMETATEAEILALFEDAMKKWKVFDAPSWSALLSALARLRGAADTSSSAVSGLGQDLAALSALTAAGLAGKQNKPRTGTLVIPAEEWKAEDAGGYRFRLDLAVADVTAADRAEVTLSPESGAAAMACGLCPTCETLAGQIRFRAVRAPESAIKAVYRIEEE